MGQMAATAGGVAIGSAVGHVVGNMLTGGGGGGGGEAQQAAPQQQQQPVQQQQPNNQQDPCQFEFKNFMDCSQQQSNLEMCQGFADALKECRTRYGIQ